MLTMLAGTAVACSRGRRGDTADGQPGQPDPGSGAPAPQATSRPAFKPAEDDTYPNAKQLAGRFVQGLTTYQPGTRWREIFGDAARRADSTLDAAAASGRARPLFFEGGQSIGEIVYPQLAGLTLRSGVERCAVMVVVRQQVMLSTGEQATVTRTVDVRLINRSGQWRIEDLADPGGVPVQRPPDLPDVAVRVLDNPRIELPDSARWDIHARSIDERLLRTMNDVAQLFPYSVAVLKSGHPVNVFATDRVSSHTLGRACDVWKIAGRDVVAQQPRKRTDAFAFTKALLREHGVPELGSPWDLDGPPVPGELRPSFTDVVHTDHVHFAFQAT